MLLSRKSIRLEVRRATLHRVVEDAGHNLPEEAPQEFADAVWELAISETLITEPPTETFGWPSVFWINLPLALVAVGICWPSRRKIGANRIGST